MNCDQCRSAYKRNPLIRYQDFGLCSEACWNAYATRDFVRTFEAVL